MTLYVAGMNDEQTTCDRCGKVELRGTVILRDGDYCEVGRYGTSCAAKLLGYARLDRRSVMVTEFNRAVAVQEGTRRAQRAVDAGLAALALWEVREVRRFRVLHQPGEAERLAGIEATANRMLGDVDEAAALAALAADMRTIHAVASGSGITLGYAFPGCPSGRMYATVEAAYADLVTNR